MYFLPQNDADGQASDVSGPGLLDRHATLTPSVLYPDSIERAPKARGVADAGNRVPPCAMMPIPAHDYWASESVLDAHATASDRSVHRLKTGIRNKMEVATPQSRSFILNCSIS